MILDAIKPAQDNDTSREDFVRDWIEERDGEISFVILDDEDGFEKLKDHHIKTDTNTGLTEKHGNMMIDLLGESLVCRLSKSLRSHIEKKFHEEDWEVIIPPFRLFDVKLEALIRPRQDTFPKRSVMIWMNWRLPNKNISLGTHIHSREASSALNIDDHILRDEMTVKGVTTERQVEMVVDRVLDTISFMADCHNSRQ